MHQYTVTENASQSYTVLILTYSELSRLGASTTRNQSVTVEQKVRMSTYIVQYLACTMH